MGLLDQVLGSLLGGSNAGGSPLQNVLTSLLNGQQGNAGYANANSGSQAGLSGGLGSLLSSFEQAGLGNIVQSWISNGPNQPVSPQQLQSVLGEDQVQTMSSQAGMAPNDFLVQLSQHLPHAVNGVTPNGRLPDEGTLSV